MQNVFELAAIALSCPDPTEKVRLTRALRTAWDLGTISAVPWAGLADVGRPAAPRLVPPAELPGRVAHNREGHGALIHAIAHIEFNAINLALDHVVRFQTFGPQYISDWLKVADEEALHFTLVNAHLQTLAYAYGDFPAHDGLWQMTVKTAHDPLARMALVPRLLEARGLDATPPIQRKLVAIGDKPGVEVLDIILRDEVGHVAIGDRWFRHLCAEKNIDPETTYQSLIEAYAAPWPQPPLNEKARLAAGFSANEIASLTARRRSASR